MDFKFLEDRFSPAQIEQIRLGLLDGINVAVYARPDYSAEDMLRIRYYYITLKEDNEKKQAEINRLAEYKNKEYYEKLYSFYKSAMIELVELNNKDGNRNGITNKYIDTIPNGAFKSLCDAENLYEIMKIGIINSEKRVFLRTTAEAYLAVVEKMFYSILKNNFKLTKEGIDYIMSDLGKISEKSKKNDFIDFYRKNYNKLYELVQMKTKINFYEACEEDVEFIRNFLFESYPTNNGYKCNMDVLLEAVKNNPWDNKDISLIGK